jgi:hypothetical protein
MTKVLLKKWSEDWSKGVEPIECVLRNKMEWTLMCILKTSSLRRKKMKCNVDQVEAQVQDKNIEDIICLKLGIHLVVMNMWRYFY